MSGLRYYLDEDVVHGPGVATELRRRGVDTIAAVEAGRAGQEQLEYATREGRVMVTKVQGVMRSPQMASHSSPPADKAAR